MRLGIGITNFSWPGPTTEIGPTIGRIARTADDAGIDSIWVMDHFFQIPITGSAPEEPMLEAYATLGFIADRTRHAQLGTLVSAVPYRHPGVLIKTVTTLDVLSRGRMTLGIGVGYPSTSGALEHEAGGLGIPFPSLGERFDRLEETLQIAHRMWNGDETPFDGTHYRLARPLNSPNAVQRPHPPILVAGGGERRTLRLVARYADACNIPVFGPASAADQLGHKLQVLRRHCDEIGRDYAQIEKTAGVRLELTDDRDRDIRELTRNVEDLAATGIDHAIIAPAGPWDEKAVDAVADIVPQVHDLVVRC